MLVNKFLAAQKRPTQIGLNHLIKFLRGQFKNRFMEFADCAIVDENMNFAILFFNGLKTLVNLRFVLQIHLKEVDIFFGKGSIQFIIRKDFVDLLSKSNG